MMNDSDPEYGTYYSDKAFWSKLQSLSGNGWCEMLKQVVTLYVLLKDSSTSMTLKITLIGALGYFIAPIDAIPDLIPLLGYTDDMSIIGMLINQLSHAITPEIEQQVRALLPKNCQ